MHRLLNKKFSQMTLEEWAAGLNTVYEYVSATLPYRKYESKIKARPCNCGCNYLKVWETKTYSENLAFYYRVECSGCGTVSWDNSCWHGAKTLDEALLAWNYGKIKTKDRKPIERIRV